MLIAQNLENTEKEGIEIISNVTTEMILEIALEKKIYTNDLICVIALEKNIYIYTNDDGTEEGRGCMGNWHLPIAR